MSKAVLFLRRHGFELYVERSPQPLICAFPPEAVSDLELIDIHKLEETINEFIKTNTLKNLEITFLLSDEVVFRKTFPTKVDDAVKAQIQQFYDVVPVDTRHVAKGQLPAGENTEYYVVNKQLYLPLKNIFEMNFLKTVGIFPLFFIQPALPVVAFGQQASLDASALSAAYRPSKQMKERDLLLLEVVEVQFIKTTTEGQIDESEKKKLVFAVVFVVGCVLGLGFIVLQAFKRPVVKPLNLPETQKAVQAPAESAAPSNTSAATSSANADDEKKKIRIQILNASGISGEAGKVKDVLTALGYGQFTTGNAEKNSVTETIVNFSQTVPVDLKNEVFSTVQQQYSNAISSTSVQLGSFDIVITIVK
jgi:hypothetical protein